ncbi:MAG: roadblock/LC7 domain-containing protein [Chloroflexaceae bacterium]|nr:roadblock/LC7 domain-containing protein [Chloroflexaceae bacterium]
MATREDQALHVLDQMLNNLGREALGAVAVGTDGVVLASRLANQDQVEHVGAVAATIFGVTQRVSRDLKQGQLEETIVKSDTGYLLVLPINEFSLLTLDLSAGANLGMARLEARWARQALSRLLDFGLQEKEQGR